MKSPSNTVEHPHKIVVCWNQGRSQENCVSYFSTRVLCFSKGNLDCRDIFSERKKKDENNLRTLFVEDSRQKTESFVGSSVCCLSLIAVAEQSWALCHYFMDLIISKLTFFSPPFFCYRRDKFRILREPNSGWRPDFQTEFFFFFFLRMLEVVFIRGGGKRR